MTTGRHTMPARGRATFRSKSLVLLGTLLILASMVAIAASRPGSVLAGPPASSLTIGTIGSQVAGMPFTVTVTAYGSNGSVKTSFTGPVTLSGLASSLGCSGCSPDIAPAAASYGNFTWNNGVGTAQVTAKLATASNAITATSGSAAPVTSNTFSVSAGALGDLAFDNGAFNGQPIDAEVGYPINSVCLPYSDPPVQPADPCGPGSVGTRVQAVDAYGNVKSNVIIDITSTPAGVTGNLSGATNADGVATFADLVIGTLGTLNSLTAMSGTATDTSNSFSIVNDLSACDGVTCKNNTSNGQALALQKAYGRITTGSDFYDPGTTNVRLTTAFVSGDETSDRCGSNETIGDSTDVKIAGLGTGLTAPRTTMVLVMTSDALKANDITSRGTPSFNVCLGALNVDPDSNATIWRAKNLGKKGGLKNSTSTANDPEGRAWGVPADCGTTGLTEFVDPCIGLRTKSANQAQTYLGLSNVEFAELGISENDLVIIIEKGAPWDGKGGVF